MIRSAEIREWRHHDVVDAKQRRIGMLEAVHVDTATDEPAMATVQVGGPSVTGTGSGRASGRWGGVAFGSHGRVVRT